MMEAGGNKERAGNAAPNYPVEQIAQVTGGGVVPVSSEITVPGVSQDDTRSEIYARHEQGRARAWDAMPKVNAGYTHGVDNVRCAIELSPHDGEPETDRVRAARVQAAEAMGERIKQGVPVVIMYENAAGTTPLFIGAVPTHDGLSISQNIQSADSTFVVGVNGIGVPLEKAWRVAVDHDAHEFAPAATVESAIDVQAGDQADVVLSRACEWSVRAATLCDELIETNVSAPRTAKTADEYWQLKADRQLHMETFVSAIHAAKAIGAPLQNLESSARRARAQLRTYLFEAGDEPQRHLYASTLHIGEAMRYLYPHEGGDEQMVEDLVVGSAARAQLSTGNFHYVQHVVRVIGQVCNTEQSMVADRLARR